MRPALIKGLKIAGIVFNALAAIFTIMAAYGGAVNPETSAVPQLLALSFPLWVILTLLLLILNLIYWRKAAIIQGATILICLGPLWGLCPLNLFNTRITPENQNRSFTLMTYNVYGFTDYRDGSWKTVPEGPAKFNPTLSYVLQQRDSIVFFQEVCGKIKHNSPEFIDEQVDSIHALYPYSLFYDLRSGALSHFPFKPLENKDSGIPDLSGNFQAMVAEIQGHRTLLVNVHLESNMLTQEDKDVFHQLTNGEKTSMTDVRTHLLRKLKKGSLLRVKEAQRVRQLIDSAGIENVIVAGDFNDVVDSHPMRIIAGDDFKSAFSKAGFGPVITYHAWRFWFHIDHVLYRGDMEAVDFKVDHFGRSDHYPVEVTFLWNK